MKPVTHFFFALFCSLFLSTALIAQSGETLTKEQEYLKVVTGRADKIVATLAIPDSAKYKRVRAMIAGQYSNLNTIQEARDQKIKLIKEQLKDDKEALAAQVTSVEDEAGAKVQQLHTIYLASLGTELTAAQIDLVKNGMTYNVLPNTLRVYQEMLPDLTARQQEQILVWLTEAREKAMDAESSEKKHAWFGKYKGKINNYLSAAGIDMKKAGADLEKRKKAAAGPN